MTPDTAAKRDLLHAKAWTMWRLIWLMVTRGNRVTAAELQAVIDGHDRRLRGK